MKSLLSLFATITLFSQVSVLALQGSESRDVKAEYYPECGDPLDAVPFLRAFHTTLGDHFYTTDVVEMKNAITKLGYNYEGFAASVFDTKEPGTYAFFRLDAPKQDHFYTTSAAERDNAVINLNYVSEGIAAYVYTNQTCGSVPLHRMFNPKIVDHFYTINATERDFAEKNLGYNDEGIAAYVLPPPS